LGTERHEPISGAAHEELLPYLEASGAEFYLATFGELAAGRKPE
jgi:hypothetical protein